MSKLFWIGAAALGGCAYYATRDEPSEAVSRLRFALLSEGTMEVDGKSVPFAEDAGGQTVSKRLYEWASAGQAKGFRIFYCKKEDGKLLMIRWKDLKRSPSGKWHLLEPWGLKGKLLGQKPLSA